MKPRNMPLRSDVHRRASDKRRSVGRFQEQNRVQGFYTLESFAGSGARCTRVSCRNSIKTPPFNAHKN